MSETPLKVSNIMVVGEVLSPDRNKDLGNTPQKLKRAVGIFEEDCNKFAEGMQVLQLTLEDGTKLAISCMDGELYVEVA